MRHQDRVFIAKITKVGEKTKHRLVKADVLLLHMVLSNKDVRVSETKFNSGIHHKTVERGIYVTEYRVG